MIDKILKRLSPPNMLRAMRFWPPYLGAGIRVESVNESLTEIQVSMGFTAANRNFVGTHFGGNLYSMCDPWFMFILLWNLGPDFVVWDRSANIQFLKPGMGRVRAIFRIGVPEIEAIRQRAMDGKRHLPTFEAQVVDESGDIVATVEKIIYVRKKKTHAL